MTDNKNSLLTDYGIDLTSVNPKPGDILVLRFDMRRLNTSQLAAVYRAIRNVVPVGMSVAAIPDECSLEQTDAARLIEIRDRIDDLLYQATIKNKRPDFSRHTGNALDYPN